MSDQEKYVKWFKNLHADEVPQVGGKNASLGEMISELKDAGIRVPGGFATTARLPAMIPNLPLFW